MAIIYQIPTQARYIPTSTVFTAIFNSTVPGKYDFSGTVTNQNVNVLLLLPNSVYLIERISCGGNIAENQYLEAINIFPQLAIKRSISRETVYNRPIPIVNYYDAMESACWIHSDKKDDYLTLSFDGLLNQLPSMLGLVTAKIQVSLSIFAVESSYWNAAFRDVQRNSIGQKNRM